MSQFSYRVRQHLWVTVPSDLGTFCNQLSHELNLPPFEHDAENIFEWGITKIEKGCIEVNISRKHKRGEPLLDEPMHILFLVENTAPVSYDEDWIKLNLIPVYGQAIANLTNQTAYHGEIKYLGGNDFSYHSSDTFDPQP